MRGGRLKRLLRWDLINFGISGVALVVITLCTCSFESVVNFRDLQYEAQFKANVFWCIVLYSLLSLPFVIFEIPCLQTVLTHSDVTGFDETGACVAFRLQRTPSEQNEVEGIKKAKPTYNGLFA